MDRLKEEREFWVLYRDVMAEKGVDISRFYADAAESVKQDFSTPGAKADFVELCISGCSPEILAFLVWLLRHSPQVSNWWQSTLGDRRKRQKTKVTLENAASTIENVFAPMLKADEKIREKLAHSRFLMPKELIAQLRLYARFITFGELLAADPGIHSLTEFVRYLLVGYVKRATGRFCDRNVSGLIGELGEYAEYDEVAQRMWRHRNYERLDEHLSSLADGLNAMGIVMAEKTKT